MAATTAAEGSAAPVSSVVELLALPLGALLERATAEGLDEDVVDQLMDEANPKDALALAIHQVRVLQLHHPHAYAG